MSKTNMFLITIAFLLILTPQVSALTSGEATLIFGAIFSMIATVIFFLVLSIMTSNVPVKIFFISLSMIVLVFSVGTGVSVITEFFSDFTSLISSFGAFYRLLTILLTAGSFALIIWLVVVALRSFWSYRGKIGSQYELDLDI